MLKIVCWKWKNDGKKFLPRVAYTAEHVNTFASMISRHLDIPYEIVCITDDPTGIDSSIRIVPLWNDLSEYGMCYNRLKIFSKEMKEIIGSKFVSMDLDCVITSNITDLFTDDSFKIWQPRKNRPAPYCGSMFMMEAGSHNNIWKDFRTSDLMWNNKWGSGVKRDRYIHVPAFKAGFTIGSDQAYLAYKMYPKVKTWVPNDGVLNFQKHVHKKNQVPKIIEDSKIVFFNGGWDPSQEMLQKRYAWIRKNWR